MLHTKFELKRKRNKLGTVGKYKARLVIWENDQDDRDLQSFSPVIDFTMIKELFYIPVQKHWDVKHFDFRNEVSNGTLSRQVYRKLPAYM